MAVAMPPHLLGLELRCFLAAGDGGLCIRIALRHTDIAERLWRQGRGLCSGSECGSSRRDTKRKLQKVPALHDMSSGLSIK
jgi:hypothetical protein